MQLRAQAKREPSEHARSWGDASPLAPTHLPGELKEREGDVIAAIHLYLRGSLPAKAARLIMACTPSQSVLTQHQQASGPAGASAAQPRSPSRLPAGASATQLFDQALLQQARKTRQLSLLCLRLPTPLLAHFHILHHAPHPHTAKWNGCFV